MSEQPIPCLWYNGRGSWCLAIAEWLTNDLAHFDPGRFVGGHTTLPRDIGAVVVIKADETDIDELNVDLARAPWVLLIVCSNEEGKFNPMAFQHPNHRLWLQTPHQHQTANHYLPWGWTPGCAVIQPPGRCWDWAFAGQITHERRRQCVAALKTMDSRRGCLHETAGFSQGLLQQHYFGMLSAAKLAPCPSGPITVDSFRVCEALELGAIPVVDVTSPTGPYPGYWTRVFGTGAPLPVLAGEWVNFPEQAKHWLSNWDRRAEVVGSWWRDWKHSLYRDFINDLADLSK